MVNLLSFDVEDYFHGPAFSHIPASEWGKQTPRLLGNMEKLLAILGEQKATFFVLGWVAKAYPHLLRQLQGLGHEIACHGYLHRHIWDLSPREFREDILSAKQTIEDVIGTEVIGFRAPTFSVTRQTLWALPLIQEAGFKYDSSIFPIRHDRYGIPGFPRQPFEIMEDFWEIPLSTVRFFRVNIPFGGGGYLRLYPYWLTRFCIKRVNSEKIPFVLYQHPWELDEMRVIAIARPKSVFATLRRSLGTDTPENKLLRLLRDWEFCPLRDYLQSLKVEKSSRGKVPVGN